MRKAPKEFLSNSRSMLIMFSIIWMLLFVTTLLDNKLATHIMLNSFHNPGLDVFFKLITYMGTLIPLGLGFAIVLLNIRKGWYIVLSQIFAFLITQPFKFGFAHKRPALLFHEHDVELPNVVDDVTLNTACNSFPSGHTSAAFALFTCFIAITPAKYRWLQITWLIMGWLVAYSRVYLSQHFAEDILFGSVIGVVASLLAYVCLYRKEWGERPLFKRCKLNKK